MKPTLTAQLTQFNHVLQQDLFPRMEPSLGPISDRAALFIAVCAMVPFAKLLPKAHWNGRPIKDRHSIARYAGFAVGPTPARFPMNRPSRAPSPNSPTPNSQPPPMKP
jgi:hypothetical protein